MEFPIQFRDTQKEQNDSSLIEQIKKQDVKDKIGINEMIDIAKTKSEKLDRFKFKQIKEKIRGKNQLVPPEKDIAFLDENSGTIYINSDNIPETSLDEVIEHEATEMVKKILLQKEKPDLPPEDQWRLAHSLALKNEYNLAVKNNHLNSHHHWIINYLKTLIDYKNDEKFKLAIQRQIEEREQIYKKLTIK